jgi:hypothetical protein
MLTSLAESVTVSPGLSAVLTVWSSCGDQPSYRGLQAPGGANRNG